MNNCDRIFTPNYVGKIIMKTVLVTIIAVITALTNLFTSADARAELKNKGDITGYSSTVSAQKELRDFQVDENDDFTVLQFSDTHLKTCISFSDMKIVNDMKAKAQEYDPDLVVIAGDMIDDGNIGAFNKSYVLRTVAEMFEDIDQYWAYVPGNNDGINYGTTEDVVAYLSQYEHCLVSDESEISGATQYSIDIYDENELTHSLVFLDTMDYDNEDADHIYGYVHEDQVKWCQREIALKKLQNSEVTVSVFQHENTPAFAKAQKSGEAYKFGHATVSILGEKYDIAKNQPLDDVFDNSGCVGLVSIGHTHPVSDSCSYYNGTYYHISTQAIISGTLITIHTSSDNIKSMYDFEAV